MYRQLSRFVTIHAFVSRTDRQNVNSCTVRMLDSCTVKMCNCEALQIGGRPIDVLRFNREDRNPSGYTFNNSATLTVSISTQSTYAQLSCDDSTNFSGSFFLGDVPSLRSHSWIDRSHCTSNFDGTYKTIIGALNAPFYRATAWHTHGIVAIYIISVRLPVRLSLCQTRVL